jgi:hypothetical protein
MRPYALYYMAMDFTALKIRWWVQCVEEQIADVGISALGKENQHVGSTTEN